MSIMVSEQPLFRRATKGVFWLFLTNIFTKLSYLIRITIVARLLAPHDFGLVGIAILTFSVLESFSELGLNHVLVQKKKAHLYLDTAWVIQLGRGMVLCVTGLIIAPLVADFFENPQAKAVISFFAVCELLKGAINIGIVELFRELKFKKYFFFSSVSVLIEVVFSIIAVFILRNVWALIWGALAGDTAKLILSYVIIPLRPKLSFERQKAKEIVHFGKWMAGLSILILLSKQGDDIVVGKILGTADLGLYRMAFFVNLAMMQIVKVVVDVGFPVYAKLQDDLIRLKGVYIKILKVVSLISMPLAGYIFILSPQITRLFLGDKWAGMVPAMRILAFYAFFNAIGVNTKAFFVAIGKPEISTKIGFKNLTILLVSIYPLTVQWGISGTALSVTIFMFLYFFATIRQIMKFLDIDVRTNLDSLMAPLTATTTMVMVLKLCQHFLFSEVSWMNFISLVGTGLVVYCLVIHVFDIYAKFGGKKLIKENLHMLFT